MNVSMMVSRVGSFEINKTLIPENSKDQTCEREELVLEDPDTWEPIVYAANRVLKGEDEVGNTHLSPIFEIDDSLNEILLKAKWSWTKLTIYGDYHPGTKDQHINYYKMPAEYFEIVNIHERFHALHHLTLDKDGDIWEKFAKICPFYLELLAQVFTYKYIEMHRKDLMDAFLELNKNQPFIYQTWRGFKDLSWQDTINLYWEIRNRLNANQPMGILGQVCKVAKVKQTTLNMAIEELIKKVPGNCIFDTHYIIKNLVKKYSDEYLVYASSFNGTSCKTLTVHGNIGKAIAKFESTLIERIDLKSWSENLHGESSPCTCWKVI